MTRIDFYELASGRLSTDQLLFQLCLKAYQNKKSTLLLTNSDNQSQHFDKILWTLEDTSFIPHEVSQLRPTLNSINIFHQSLADNPFDILINLNQEIPPHFGQFERVIELVHDLNKDIARLHFKFYKDRGYAINHNKV